MNAQTLTDVPEDLGVRLATFERKMSQELRLTVDEYRGCMYFHARVWAVCRDGTLRPTRKGVSIRLSEAREFAAAINAAMDNIDAYDEQYDLIQAANAGQK